ncbi:MAG: SPOR domain-containing protein [Desulfatibacillaceae bacterium]
MAARGGYKVYTKSKMDWVPVALVVLVLLAGMLVAGRSFMGQDGNDETVASSHVVRQRITAQKPVPGARKAIAPPSGKSASHSPEPVKTAAAAKTDGLPETPTPPETDEAMPRNRVRDTVGLTAGSAVKSASGAKESPSTPKEPSGSPTIVEKEAPESGFTAAKSGPEPAPRNEEMKRPASGSGRKPDVLVDSSFRDDADRTVFRAYTVQVGAFLDPTNAKKVAGRLRSSGHFPRVFIKRDKRGRVWHAVRFGVFPSESDAAGAATDFSSEAEMEALARPYNAL